MVTYEVFDSLVTLLTGLAEPSVIPPAFPSRAEVGSVHRDS